MKFLLYLSLFTFGSWGLLAGLLPADKTLELFLGMIGPYLVGIITVVLIRKTISKSPELLNDLMLKSFFSKILFYGVYISMSVIFGGLDPVYFIIAFASYFIVLHIIEALYFRSIIQPKKS